MTDSCPGMFAIMALAAAAVLVVGADMGTTRVVSADGGADFCEHASSSRSMKHR